MDSPKTPAELNSGPAEITAEKLVVHGIVQGVGMRPFVVRLAGHTGVSGLVRNDGAHLVIEAAGTRSQLEAFKAGLRRDAPPAARIVRLTTTPGGQAVLGAQGFDIAESRPAPGLVLISPDLAICPDCQREINDPADRRHEHALISCMHCGPRYSILRKLPYDRPQTSMAGFPLCPACQKEYAGVNDRRYHAQTISCPDCGPQLELTCFAGNLPSSGREALAQSVRILRDGGILAVKGIGGYHLACCTDNADAIRRLRQVKQRDAKPFAVLFPDLASIRRFAGVTPDEAGLLESPARPIVLLEPLPAADTDRTLHPDVSSGSRLLGAFLPCSPLQVLLAEKLGPLVMTSANLNGDVICTDDQAMEDFVRQYALDGVLAHDRPIETGLDDSVMRMADGHPLMIRRARGFVPLPVDLVSSLASSSAISAEQAASLPQIIAAGSDLKAAVALCRDGLCYPGAPVGDLTDLSVTQAWQEQLARLTRLLDCQPACLAVDRHPDYLSAQMLRRAFPGTPVLAIQHHHAHIAAVLAENPGISEAIGVAFDGTGYGEDGTVWGGEWLVCRGAAMQRAAALKPVAAVGGDQARRRPWQSLLHHLIAAGPASKRLISETPCLANRKEQAAIVAAACRQQLGTVASSSMGSLFDAVAALLGYGEINHYEGQCAQTLEQAAAEARRKGLSAGELRGKLFSVVEQGDDPKAPSWLDPAPLFPELAARMADGADPRVLALAFHEALAMEAAAICCSLSRQTGIGTVALGGGCFQNALLLELTAGLLRQHGLKVLSSLLLPPGDGGLAVGQVWLVLQGYLEQSAQIQYDGHNRGNV